MAKPIFVVKLPISVTKEMQSNILNELKKNIGLEYHVLVACTVDYEKIEMECFNDCKGLPDVDIAELIKSYTENKIAIVP